MNRILAVLRSVLHLLATPIRLVRQGDSDLDGAYPDRARANGTEAATQGSVTGNLMNPGGASGM